MLALPFSVSAHFGFKGSQGIEIAAYRDWRRIYPAPPPLPPASIAAIGAAAGIAINSSFARPF